MTKKLALCLLAACAVAAPAVAAPAAVAAPETTQVATGSAELPLAIIDLVVCLVQLPPSASGDPSQGCPS